MKLCILLVLCASALMACEQTSNSQQPLPEFPIGIVPGTRLSPKLLLADDGTMFPHPKTWKDSDFGDCEFRTAADGKYRCLPNVLQPTSLGYLDAACLQQAFVYTDDLYCEPMTEYVSVPSTPNACGVSESVRVYKADVKVDALTVYQKAGSQCVAWLTFQSPAEASVYLLVDEMDPGLFVSAWR